MNPTEHDNPDSRLPRAASQLLAALIGLGPLLVASRNFSEGLALGVASFAVLCLGNLLAATVGRLLPARGRTAALLMLIGALVTAVDLGFQAWWPWPDRNLLLFVPLILTNGLLADRAGQWATAPEIVPTVGRALLDALRLGLVFIMLLAGIGALRATLAPSLGIALSPAGLLLLLAGLLATVNHASHRFNS